MRIDGFPYEYFDGIDCNDKKSEVYKDNNFIKTFLVGKKSFVTDDVNFNLKNDDVLSLTEKLSKIEENKDLKEFLKENELNANERIVLDHLVWLWQFPNTRNSIKTASPYLSKNYRKEYFTSKGIGGESNMSHTRHIKRFISLADLLIELLKKKKDRIDEVKTALVDLIKNKMKTTSNDNNDKKVGFMNPTYLGLLHLCNPQIYETLLCHSDVKEVCTSLYPEKKDSDFWDQLVTLTSQERVIPIEKHYYSDGFMHFWKKDDNPNDDYQKLLYKKAMILYGPPGTGKTYVATNLANELIGRKFAEAYKASGNQKIIDEFFKKNIFRLQLHVNYTYEDFVAGVVIKNNSTDIQEGYIYKVIKRANDLNDVCPDLPVVVILDEINRTDISRVFGELFSAIEKRGETIDLSLQENGQPKQICIPNNVYFIGTMNEIDFSLERVDFALRRRFIWLLKTYEKKVLETILKEKDHEDVVEKYVSLCNNLNKVITDEQELGEKFVIGHAFFSEIANIMDDLSMNYEEAKHMLWQISIFPTLEAYCGSMDKRKQDEFIEKCAKAFDFEYKDGKVSLKSTTDANTSKQPSTGLSVNGTNEESSTVSTDE